MANVVRHPGERQLNSDALKLAYVSAVQAHRAGDLSQAERLYRRVLSQDPNYAEALHGLGTVANRLGRPREAVEHIRRAVAIDPSVPEAHYNLAQVLRLVGDLEGAIGSYKSAVDLRPHFVEAWNNLGVVLKQTDQIDPAISAYRKAIELGPDDIEPRYNLGNVLAESGNPGEAITVYREALSLRPDAAHVIAALGNALRDSGEIDAALDCYRRSVAIHPDPDVASNLAYTLYLDPSAGPSDIFKAHQDWDTRYARPLSPQIRPHSNDRSPDRRIRVGYVSPDLSLHPVGRFTLPILENRDRDSVEVYSYADGPEDQFTARLRNAADTWRTTGSLSHQQLADQIRGDAIDVLVDLSLHTRHNRLLTFARKPAPVQLSYLAYCGATGLSTIEYRLTDPYLNPAGQGESNYSERSVRLPDSYWCFHPLESMPEIAPPPVLAAGHVTFASFGSFAKVSPLALRTWIRILQSVPTSRLLIHSPLGPHRDRIRVAAEERGVARERIEFFLRLPLSSYFGLFDRVDIALDSFPCSGATVICDSLWMGVPVVTLAGNNAMARSGLSIVSNAGLPELAGCDVDQYISIAVNLAGDLPRLLNLRSTLRRRLAKSPLTDAARFTRSYETALRTMWRAWCQNS